MTMLRVKVDGLKELSDALLELPKSTANNILRRVMRAELQPIADDVKTRVPMLHGDLKRSITVSTKLTKRQRSQHRKFGPKDVEMFMGAGSNPQAHMQEFGTRHYRAQPYLRPAWDAHRFAILEHLAGAMWAEIDKAVARRARKLARKK
jgi:HK97 gp10 family phage protein